MPNLLAKAFPLSVVGFSSDNSVLIDSVAILAIGGILRLPLGGA